MNIPQELVDKTKAWLGEDGISFFKNCVSQHGNVAAIWNEGGIPHMVHFREGMNVRNFMRSSGLCISWNDHDYDNHWVRLIERCLDEVAKN